MERHSLEPRNMGRHSLEPRNMEGHSLEPRNMEGCLRPEPRDMCGDLLISSEDEYAWFSPYVGVSVSVSFGVAIGLGSGSHHASPEAASVVVIRSVETYDGESKG